MINLTISGKKRKTIFQGVRRILKKIFEDGTTAIKVVRYLVATVCNVHCVQCTFYNSLM